MAYEQVLPFYPKDMGTASGWCLKNCRIGFHIYTAKYASAKAAMLAAKKNGTLHPLSELPSNISVPVYYDVTSKYEHVVVYDKGTWYSDGKKIAKPTWACFGWDEMMDGVRVVKKTSGTSFLPPKGYWKRGDRDPRIGRLNDFYANTFPSYSAPNKAIAKALLKGNLFGYNCQRWTREFQKRTGLYPDGIVGEKTYAKLRSFGFKG